MQNDCLDQTDLCMEAERQQLSKLIQELTAEEGLQTTAIEELVLFRSDGPTNVTPGIMEPALCVMVQGSKVIYCGEEIIHYTPLQYLLVPITIAGKILHASSSEPYLAMRMNINMRELTDLVIDTASHGKTRIDSQAHRIASVIEMIQQRFAQPLRIKELAESVYLSESALFSAFKAVTTMSPLQFQKQLRLNEARRLMLNEGTEAATASYKVGYESPSQFSREYSRLFGAPPKADMARFRQEI